MKQKWITTDLNSLNNYFDGINQIYQGEVDGIHIKQVFSKDEMQQAQEKLGRKKASEPDLVHAQTYGELVGAILTANGSDTREYFSQANLVRSTLKESFEPDYETTIENIFSKLSGGRKVALAHQNGDTYSPSDLLILIQEESDYIKVTNLFILKVLQDYTKLFNCETALVTIWLLISQK